jgi:integrase/recombinase XerD
MAGKQAKILSDTDLASVLSTLATTRHPQRSRVMVLLSAKAGLRAAEVAKLTWSMLLDASGNIGPAIELQDRIAKKRGGRIIPMHPLLAEALRALKGAQQRPEGPVVRSERGGHMTPVSVCNAFANLFRLAGLEGASSHSGRRTFITKAARAIGRVGGSLRDAQILAGHKSIQTTERYIEANSEAQQQLMRLI